jgi:hypothetical protein
MEHVKNVIFAFLKMDDIIIAVMKLSEDYPGRWGVKM